MKQRAIINEKRFFERFWGSWLTFSDLRCRSIHVRSFVVLEGDGLIGEGLANRVEIFYAADFLKLFLVDTFIPRLLDSLPSRTHFSLLVTTIVPQVRYRSC
jgi:hypothetical protein